MKVESNQDYKEVSVVIPHYNDLKNLRVCVYSVLRQNPDEVIIVDDGSPNPPSLNEAPFNDSRVLLHQKRRRLGAAKRRNQGVQLAHNERLAFIDSDMIPSDNWLENGLGLLEEHDVVGGVYRKYFTGPHPSIAERYSLRFQNPTRAGQMGASGNLFTRRECLVRAGGWTLTPFVTEDVDIFQKLRAVGLDVVVDEAVVGYHPAFTAGQKLRRIKRSAQRVRFHGAPVRFIVSRSLPWWGELHKAFRVAQSRREAWGFFAWHCVQRIAFFWYWLSSKKRGDPTW